MIFCPNKSIRIPFILGVFLLGAFYLSGKVLAQNFSLGVSSYYPVEQEVTEGDIIVYKDGIYQKSSARHQSNIIGVYVENPSFEFRPEDTSGKVPILSSGDAYVRVSTVNGEIKQGDFLTTSEIVGAAMKATDRGIILGTALEDFSQEDPTNVGRILVQIDITDTKIAGTIALEEGSALNLIDVFSASKRALYESPSDSFKYIVAAIVVIVSFIFGFITFKKVAVKGVEAIGRNPLASKIIGFGILMNLIITVSIIIAGLILAYFIVTL